MFTERIAYLDGLRGIAISLVLLHHYCSRWTYPIEAQNLYPYGDAFASFTLAKYGYFGVHLFFVISGFVITLTLHRCSSAAEFFLRRFARLWPTMALCCVLTWLVVPMIPGSPFIVAARNFLPSLTFIEPSIFNYLLHTASFDWMDGAYWSLWVEVRFYFLAAILYFISPARFTTTLLSFSAVVLIAYALAMWLGMTNAAVILKGLFIAQHLPWFLFGIAFYMRREGPMTVGLIGLAGAALLAQALTQNSIALLVALVCIPTLVWAGRTRVVGRILSMRALTYVGATSYSLYLLHQKIGVSLIHAAGMHWQGPATIVFAVIVAALLIFIAGRVFHLWETPLSRAITSNALWWRSS